MVAVIVSHTCPICAYVHVSVVPSNSNLVFDVPNLHCAKCGTAPAMTYKVSKVTTMDAVAVARAVVSSDLNNEILAELNKG